MHSSTIAPTHTIAALATPRYKSALALIRISGEKCIAQLAPFISPPTLPLEMWTPNTTQHCILCNPSTQTMIDDAMVTIYRAPRSYTGQDCLEISLHGNPLGIDIMLSALYAHGIEPATPGEFTQRAFLNGKIDLTQAEAVHTLIEAHTTESRSLALQQLSGSVSRYIEQIKQTIMNIAAVCTVALDYPEDEIQESTTIDVEQVHQLINQLSKAIESYELSKISREGATVILAGRTNAGKSALFNSLLKEERAIVSSTHGTTRDFLEIQITLKGIPLRIFDTAGLRTLTSDNIELEGMQRSQNLIMAADLILYIIDSTLGISTEDEINLAKILEKNPTVLARLIIVWNKIDIEPHKPQPHLITIPISDSTRSVEILAQNIVSISTTVLTNIQELQEIIFSTIHSHSSFLSEDLTVISSLRQKQHLESCRNSLVHVIDGLTQNFSLDMISLDVDSALTALGNITGEVSNEDVLDIVFSNFCLGK